MVLKSVEKFNLLRVKANYFSINMLIYMLLIY